MTVKVDVARTCPTLLSAWMLEYGVGYYVEPPIQENSLGGRTLAVYTLQAQLVAVASAPAGSQWLRRCRGSDAQDLAAVCSFSMPVELEGEPGDPSCPFLLHIL